MGTTAAPRAVDPALRVAGGDGLTARAIAEAAARLAAPSPVVRGALDLLDAGDAPARTLAARLSQSPELAAQVLRLANSAAFGGRADSIDAAVVRLGEQTLRALLLAAETYSLLEGPLPVYGLPRLALFRHSNDVAETAQSLAKQSAAARGGQAFLAGLLHDLGKPILAAVAAEGTASVGPCGDLDGERRVFGTDHARVGTWIARRWGLPEELCDAIEYHHSPVPPDEPVARAVWLGDIVAHAASGSIGAMERLPLAADACGMSSDALEALLTASPAAEGPQRPPGLTDREIEVLRALATGSTAKQVARELGCSVSTVHNHLHHVYGKLDVAGQSQALLLARERGWV